MKKVLPVSVLMSVYVKENQVFLTESVESILNDDCLPSQVVIVKDGALNEGLDAALDGIQSDLVKIDIIGYESNRGLGYALNFGLRACNESFVMRMDSDDICLPGRLLRQYSFMLRNPNLAICGGDIEEFSETVGDLQVLRKVPYTNEKILNTLKYRSPFNHQTVMFRKDKVIAAGGYRTMYSFEDYYLWYRLCEKYPCENLNEVLVFARVGNGLVGRRSGLEYFNREISFQRKMRQLGYLSYFELIRNIILRGLPRLLPSVTQKYLYTYLLRSK